MEHTHAKSLATPAARTRRVVTRTYQVARGVPKRVFHAFTISLPQRYIGVSTIIYTSLNWLQAPASRLYYLNETVSKAGISISEDNPSRDLDQLSLEVGFDIGQASDGSPELFSEPLVYEAPGGTSSHLHPCDFDPNIVSPPCILHFKDRILLGSYYPMRFSSPLIWVDESTIRDKRDLTAGPHGSVISRAYCMSALKAYPSMLCCSGKMMPPFIHAFSQRFQGITVHEISSGHAKVLPEPLSICSGIMQMYMTRSSGNIAFIWRTIHAETQRIANEVSKPF